jgi:hypothetical protein
MEVIIIAGCILIVCCILCFDLLEIAVRRLLLVSILIFAAMLLAPVYFCIGLYQGFTQDKQQARDNAEKINQACSSLWRIYCKAWSIPVKVLMIEPHINKAVKSGIKDGLAFRRWSKRTQLNPNHPYTVLHPARSFVKAMPYIMHKYSQKAQGKRPLDPERIETLWDILP